MFHGPHLPDEPPYVCLLGRTCPVTRLRARKTVCGRVSGRARYQLSLPTTTRHLIRQFPGYSMAHNCCRLRSASFPVRLLLKHLFVFVRVSFAPWPSCLRATSTKFPTRSGAGRSKADRRRRPSKRQVGAISMPPSLGATLWCKSACECVGCQMFRGHMKFQCVFTLRPRSSRSL